MYNNEQFYVAENASIDKRGKPRLASHQLAERERQYRITPCPTRKTYQELADRINLPKRKIVIWFYAFGIGAFIRVFRANMTLNLPRAIDSKPSRDNYWIGKSGGSNHASYWRTDCP